LKFLTLSLPPVQQCFLEPISQKHAAQSKETLKPDQKEREEKMRRPVPLCQKKRHLLKIPLN